MIYAIQIEGLDAAKFVASMGMDPSSMPKTTIGGKTVYGRGCERLRRRSSTPRTTCCSCVLLVDETTAASVLEQLP